MNIRNVESDRRRGNLIRRSVRNVALATGVGLTAVTGGMTVVAAVEVGVLEDQISKAQPKEVFDLRARQKAYFNLMLVGLIETPFAGLVVLFMQNGFSQSGSLGQYSRGPEQPEKK